MKFSHDLTQREGYCVSTIWQHCCLHAGKTKTPRDEGPQRAYLNGVDRSSVFRLMLGSRYGVTDQTGYSPTHQEGNRAAEKRIPRLLFELASLKDSERDGRLNDWLRSLHHEISGASFTNDGDLVAQLDARLREMAAQSERLWIKLGALLHAGDYSPVDIPF